MQFNQRTYWLEQRLTETDASRFLLCILWGFFHALCLIGTELEEQDMEHKAIILTNMITKILLY